MTLDDFLLNVTQIRCFKKCVKIEKDYKLCEASGFFYRHSDAELYLITNRHVVIDEEEHYRPDEIRLSLATSVASAI